MVLAFHASVFRFLERVSCGTAEFLNTHPIITGIFVFTAMIPICYVFERWLPFLIGRSSKKIKDKMI